MTKFRHTILNEMTLGGRYRAIPEEPLHIIKILQQVKEGDPNSKEQFQSIFFCYRTPSPIDLFCFEILFIAIKEKKLDIFNEFISIPPKLDTSLMRIGGGKRVTESPEYQGMKLWLIDFLNSKDIPSECEISQLGYEVDVGCLEKQIFIECGDTEPRKVFEFLRHNLSIGILQYDSEEIVWFKPKETFIEFANSKAKGFLA